MVTSSGGRFGASHMRVKRHMAAEFRSLFSSSTAILMRLIQSWGNHYGDPMRATCPDLAVTSLRGAHWLPLECKAELIQAIRTWLQSKKL
jgi:hypothetical protein